MKRSKILFTGFLCSILISILGISVFTVSGNQIDQGDVPWDPTPTSFASVSISFVPAQSFIPTVQNISAIDIHVHKDSSSVTGNLTVSITKTFDGDAPLPEEINGTIEVVPDDVMNWLDENNWITVNFSDPIEVTPLETFYIVLQGFSDTSGEWYYWTIDQGNPYPNGTRYDYPSYDQFFRTYYLEPVVPEFPSKIFLVIIPVTVIAVIIVITKKHKKGV